MGRGDKKKKDLKKRHSHFRCTQNSLSPEEERETGKQFPSLHLAVPGMGLAQRK